MFIYKIGSDGRKLTLNAVVIGMLALLPLVCLEAAEWSGYVSEDIRFFTESPSDSRQHGNNISLVAEPEFYHEWDNSNQNFTFTPFVRLDQGDDERTHADIRELVWMKVSDNWELKAGVSKVFWGVTESLHLVDIINQTDLVENTYGEDKLGQPMVTLSLIQNWGVVDLFVLPYFRERTFPGVKGRLRTSPYVDTDQAIYQSSREQNHIDYSARWSQTLSVWDIGLSYFAGTSRDPRFILGSNSLNQPVLIPVYDLIKQTGLDVQGTFDAWLWKLEAIYRTGQGEAYAAITGGFEYTLYGVVDSDIDVGILLEYLYDDRGDQAPTPFQDDFLIASRIAFNDAQSTEILIGAITAADSVAPGYSIEASRRFGDNWKVSLESRFFHSAETSDPLNAFSHDDYIEFDAAYYF